MSPSAFLQFCDYFQTSLNDSICMPQLSSQTRTSVSPFFVQAAQDTLAPWDSQILHQSLHVSAQGLDAAQKFHCCEVVSVSGTGRSPSLPTAFLRSCLVLPGRATGYGTGDTSSFPALPDPALSHTAPPQSLLCLWKAPSFPGKPGPGAGSAHRAFRLN